MRYNVRLTLFGLLGVGALGAFTLCDLCSTASTASSAVAPFAAAAAAIPSASDSDSATVTLSIRGMTCGGCAIATRKMLTGLDGVARADVSYETQLATVVYDPAKVTIEQMIAAVKKLGYTATVAGS